LAARRRRLAGPTGCGLCGIESLAEAVRPLAPVAETGLRVTGRDLLSAMAQMEAAQAIGPATRAVHAAGLWTPGALLVREDVGRHNALDKLVGAAARAGRSPEGLLLLTSRVSVELVQKAAVFGAPVVCAMSAPTALAVRTAQAVGITLVAVARADGFEVFTHPERVIPG
jgi:FdhD protein